ncbi:hypothetical protein Slin15195_G051560 [Septoria linicola]|uniref:Uncharacterized protein n=1 Tax=Septoria linicola TaxID=215465 RepID=A0A9Q9ATQ9_9PEZI|nr:hypothetical protein Slin15195_G051560 [Septoria linicola]
MDNPESPIKRRVSNARLRSPLPDLAQGGVTISRLERSAEEMSAGGSDIGEEIKKLQARERSASASRSSRQNSIQSSHQGGEFATNRGTSTWKIRSRANSNNYHSNNNNNNIVDVSSNARWGGYSPVGHMTSPIGSVRSGSSWTPASLHRAASGSISSRLGHTIVEPLQEGRPLDSPLAPSSASLYSQEHAISRQASQSSFARRYDHIAAQIEESLATIPPTPPIEDQQEGSKMDYDPIERPRSADTFQEAQLAFQDFDGVHYNPDTEEYVELDQDGHEIRRVSARTSSGTLGDMASMLRTPRQTRAMSSGRPLSYGRPMSMALGAPPPGEDMVYYPAPVPRMLNLPKRLSQLPPSHVQAKRRSEMLQAMPRANRESAPWIPPIAFGEDREQENATRSVRSGSGSTTNQDQQNPRGMLNQRMSMANPSTLPPQLRASMFFQQPSVEHNVEVQNGSAVATLDAILASSANAPVTAFTDHPYAGDVRRTVYAAEKPQHNRRSTANTLDLNKSESPQTNLKKKRSSSIGNFFRRNSTNLDGETEGHTRSARKGSALDLNENGNKLRKRRSQMSLGQMSVGDDLDRVNIAARTPGEESGDPLRRQSGLIGQAFNADHRVDEETEQRAASGTQQMDRELLEGEQIDQDFRDEQQREDWDLEDPLFAQPTTLLAELQVRKAQLKSRNKTAATAFPNGMHSTLLQLDAVEAIEAKKRQKKKIALAWEDHQGTPDDNSDDGRDDVPLGMLYPSKSGNAHRKMGNERDWGRPLGLMERRELEENEPLGHRRKRLNPNAAPLMRANTGSQLHLAGQPDTTPDEDEAEEGETLGERIERLRRKKALDGAISDVHKDGQEPDNSFTDELLGQFGGLQVTNPDANASDKSTLKEQTKPGAVEENETLGQRAARLRREREASGESATDAARPAILRSASSMANLLSTNPVGNRQASRESEAAQGTLLHASQQHQMRQKQDLLASNMRTSSYNLSQPLVDSRPRAAAEMSGGLIGNESSRPANGLFAGAKYTGAVNTSGSSAAPNRSTSFGGLLGHQQSRPANGLFNPAAYNAGYGGAGLQPSMSMPGFGMNVGQGYFASPTAGMSYGAYGAQPSMMGYPQMQQQQMDPAAYYAMNGGYGYPQQQQHHHMAYPQQPAMASPMNVSYTDPAQASSIERWRQSIGPA